MLPPRQAYSDSNLLPPLNEVVIPFPHVSKLLINITKRFEVSLKNYVPGLNIITLELHRKRDEKLCINRMVGNMTRKLI